MLNGPESGWVRICKGSMGMEGGPEAKAKANAEGLASSGRLLPTKSNGGRRRFRANLDAGGVGRDGAISTGRSSACLKLHRARSGGSSCCGIGIADVKEGLGGGVGMALVAVSSVEGVQAGVARSVSSSASAKCSLGPAVWVAARMGKLIDNSPSPRPAGYWNGSIL